MYKIVKVNTKNKAKLSLQINNLKKSVDYPLGEQYFNIDHGDDYFAYYESIGIMHYWCVLDKEKVIATICGMIKTLKSGKKAWYFCDLKVNEKYRKQGIARKLFRKVYFYMLFFKGCIEYMQYL